MLSCKDVRDALPGIESGEPADGAVRDHLSGCAGCKQESARVRADLRALRRDLAGLAPSPFLADAVVDAARDPESVTQSRRSRASWKPVLVTLAAASLLIAVIVVPRLVDPGGAPIAGRDGSNAPMVALPPTAGMVASARKANAPNFDYASGDGFRHWYRNAAQGLTTYAKDTIDPPAEGVDHRWVFRPGEQGVRTVDIVGVPPRGVQVLGKELLDRVGGVPALTLGEYLRSTSYGTLVVSSPVAGGPSATIAVVLRPDYTGSVLLEEPLARALGLQQFEIPGGCRIEGDSTVAGHRALARVRLEPVRFDTLTKEHVALPVFDEVVEVQVRGAPYPLEVDPAATAPRLILENATPDGLDVSSHGPHLVSLPADPIPTGPDSRARTEIALSREGPTYVRLLYAEGKRPACTVFLPPLDVGGGHPAAYRVRLERVELQKRYEPGAEVVVSRVWQGDAAITSRESVCVTTAAGDGTVSFVRAVGENGRTLRARIRGANGEVSWVDVKLGRKTLVMNLLASGQLHVKGYVFALLEPDGAFSGPEAIAQITAHIRKLVEQLGARDARGVSDIEVLISAEAATPWRLVQWVMQMCAHPDVQAPKLRFKVIERDDAPIVNDLPLDRGLQPIEREPAPSFKVRLFRDGTATKIRVGTETLYLGLGKDRGELDDLTARLRRKVAEAGASVRVEIAAPPPKGGSVPYQHVWLIMRALHESGAQNVLFEGAAMPR